jgi:Prion-inhibition and propagation/EB1-like C-terminal motif
MLRQQLVYFESKSPSLKILFVFSDDRSEATNMEVIGAVASGLTIAALFKTCVEAFDLIQLYQGQDADFKKLLLRLNVEKCRLYVWGQSMRLTSASTKNAVDDCPFIDVLKECLNQILETFNNSERIREKYGCQQMDSSSKLQMETQQQLRNVKILAAAFSNFRIRDPKNRKLDGKQQPTSLRKTQWIIRDRKKFLLLIQEVQNLIDGLKDITKELSSAAKQEEKINSRVMNIRDTSTLNMVADVCEESHPQIAYAASTRAESISVVTSNKQHIANWRAQIESDESDGTSVSHLENLTVTELKYQISRLLRDRLEANGGDSRIAVATKPEADTDNPSATQPAVTIDSLQAVIAGLELERDFYYSKLRDIELLSEAEKEQNLILGDDPDNWVKNVQEILYATQEGFEAPPIEDEGAVSAI